ncbi:MAG TPA: hypothetical protein VFZ25_10300, partial [Chloroflexota bacterium]|nr:hypothetical protein [Chloroflexota bacterium]
MHTGIEEKIPWQAVQPEIRRQVADVLGARVARASRVWGGYGPTPTFRLLLADGRRVFLKGVNAASNEFARRGLTKEEEIYRRAGDLIRGWTPVYLGSFHHGDWHVLMLEDLGPKTVPPWAPASTAEITRSFAEIHRLTLGAALPNWLPREPTPFGPAWEQIAEASNGFRHIAA